MTGYRRNLLYGLYALALAGLVLVLAGPRTAGTIVVVAAVIGVVGVSVTGRVDE